jgi:formylglycine-generating enzyme required for sulfatase activity
VFNRLCIICMTLASLALTTGCTTDFSGYHLGATAGAGGSLESGGESAAGGAAASNGGDNRAGDSAANAGDAAAGSGALSEAGASGGGVSGGGVSGGGPASGGKAGSPGALAGAGASGEDAGAAGSDVSAAPLPASCDGLPKSCGPDRNASCCAAALVPGGTYNRSNLPTAPATVSPFALDVFEITVGRLRKFVHAYSQTLTPAGAGKNPGNPLDSGWSETWNAKLPASAALLSAALSCPNGTFTATAGANENLPATCLSWYEASAFCIWDGGRLPTEAEWNYAAAAGSDERVHPWGGALPDDSFAVFCPGSCGKVQAVGSKPAGNGKWGHADLVGNAWEWNVDAFANPYAQASCVDCANSSITSTSQRTFRGGSAGNDASYLLSATRSSRDPADHNGFVGARCARSP